MEEIILNDAAVKLNKERLNCMSKRAKKRMDFLKEHLSELNRKECYIRIAGSGFRAISLLNDSPLCGFKATGYDQDINKMLEHCSNDPTSPVKGKPEWKIQCFLIKYALSNKLDLKEVLGINSIYDELLFALDEVPLVNEYNKQKIRCDILAVGVQGKIAFPVLIELKPGRLKKRLTDQLNNFCDKVHDEFPNEFADLLGNCVDRKISTYKIGKMIIWPSLAGDSLEQTIPDFEKKGVDVIEYEGKPDDVTGVVFKPLLLKGPRAIL